MKTKLSLEAEIKNSENKIKNSKDPETIKFWKRIRGILKLKRRRK